MKKSDESLVLELLRICFSKTAASTHEWWDWKYNQNPCGPALLLVAEKNAVIIGLRAFWPRSFVYRNQTYTVYQATDTAVHPDERGKGVFSQLTNKALEILQQSPPTAIFNFPNNRSGPGYLKMGWRPVRKLRWWIRITPNRKTRCLQPINPPDCLAKISDTTYCSACGFVKNAAFTKWRYIENPKQQYQFWAIGNKKDELLYAVTSVVKKKGFRIRVLIDLIYPFCNYSEKPSDNWKRTADLLRAIPVSPSLPLCVLDSSFKPFHRSILLKHGFLRLPWVKANFFTRYVNEFNLAEKLTDTAIFPGDMDTF